MRSSQGHGSIRNEYRRGWRALSSSPTGRKPKPQAAGTHLWPANGCSAVRCLRAGAASRFWVVRTTSNALRRSPTVVLDILPVVPSSAGLHRVSRNSTRADRPGSIQSSGQGCHEFVR
jgi:hypothetical protein